jgi:hypothetical protein
MPARLATILIVAAACLGWMRLPGAAQAAGELPVSEAQAIYTFGSELTIEGRLPSNPLPQSATVYWQAQGEASARDRQAVIDEQGLARAVIDLQQAPLPPFAQVDYWFAAVLADGQMVSSPRFSFRYEDNRFTWQSLQAPPLSVHWYEGDAGFGEDLLNTAQAGLQQAQRLLPSPLPVQLDVYVYHSPREVQTALQLVNLTWVAGHANPDLNLVLVSVFPGPEQRLEMERQIPHELMHILLNQNVQKLRADGLSAGAYQSLPVWLNEGLASAAELYPNPDYLLFLEDAVQKRELIPMAELCTAFPKDASGAVLAYAQAASFTRYLHQKFGAGGLQALVSRYADGLDCGRGVEAALGMNLQALEQRWLQETFQVAPPPVIPSSLVPWISLFGIIIAGPLLLGLLRPRRAAPAA